jgi:hypothetical protein
MKTKMLTALLVVCITLTVCAVCITVLGDKKVVENPLEGVVLEIKENTLTNTGLTLIIKNVSPNDYVYGSKYDIDKKINDNWEPVPVRDIPIYWVDTANMLNGNSVTELEIGWVWLYGELSPGNYRVVKNFAYSTSYNVSGDYYPISVEFTID